MITQLAKKMSRFCTENNVVPKEDEQVYEYSFELLLSTIFNICAVTAIAICTGCFIESVFFFAGFVPLRMIAGGYHAKNHFRCFLILIATYIAFIGLLCIIQGSWYLPLICILSGISFLLIFLFSPIEDSNKPLSQEEKKTFKAKSRVNIIICLVIAGLLYVLLPDKQYAFSFTLGILTVCLSLLASMIRNKCFNVPS